MQASQAIPQTPQAGEEQRSALAVIVVVVAGLILGLALKASVEWRATAFEAPGGLLSLRYPSSWVAGSPLPATLLTVTDRRSAALFDPTFAVYERDLKQGQRLVDAVDVWVLGRVRSLREFRDLGSEQVTFAGRPATRLNYAYVADPPPGAGPATLPIVVRCIDTIVLAGDQFLVFSAQSDASQGELDSRLGSILSSVKLK
jgi:hypothetical protein